MKNQSNNLNSYSYEDLVNLYDLFFRGAYLKDEPSNKLIYDTKNYFIEYCKSKYWKYIHFALPFVESFEPDLDGLDWYYKMKEVLLETAKNKRPEYIGALADEICGTIDDSSNLVLREKFYKIANKVASII